MERTRNSIKSLITSLCTSGSSKLDDNDLKNLKTICKQNDENIKICYHFLIVEIKKNHCEIRFSAFQICDELFMRSHLFRQLLLDDFQLLFELALETNRSNLLPPPKEAANKLKELAAQSIKKWHTKYGNEYKLLDLGFKYLKDIKRIDFETFNTLTLAERKNREEANKKKEFFLNQECLQFIKEQKECEIEIKNCLEQFNNCFKILVPTPFDFLHEQQPKNYSITTSPTENSRMDFNDENSDCSNSESEEDEFIEVKTEKLKEDDDIEMRYLGFLKGNDSEYVRHFNMSVNVNIDQNEENSAVIENIKDLYKELKNCHLEKIKKWIKTFSMVKTAVDPLKKAIELKNSVQIALKKYEDLKIERNDEKRILDDKKILKKSVVADKQVKVSSQETKFNQINSKNDLLKIAPVLDLNEIQVGVSLSSKVEADNKWYTKQDYSDTTISSFNANTLLKKTFIGTFEPVKWKCLSPMPNGKLCQRMDRFKCPFHGKIIARDPLTGKAKNEEEEKFIQEQLKLKKKNNFKKNEKESCMPEFDDPTLIRDIEAATGQNLGLRKKQSNSKCKRIGGNLTKIGDLESNSSRKRLEGRILSTKSLQKVGNILDNIEFRLNKEKFHHNFNYSINS